MSASTDLETFVRTVNDYNRRIPLAPPAMVGRVAAQRDEFVAKHRDAVLVLLASKATEISLAPKPYTIPEDYESLKAELVALRKGVVDVLGYCLERELEKTSTEWATVCNALDRLTKT